ncbi:hypothetical protein G6F21_014333 [Rhizopus arrhizus]|nr:hypothetical protein G6F21_014333 [Rhizopus arrhizus]
MAEAHGLPVRHQQRRPAGDRAQLIDVGRGFAQGLTRRRFTAFRIEAVDDVIRQRLEQLRLATRRPMFKRAEPHESG